MKAENFIYAPPLKKEFRCKVPLPQTQQLFVVNGKVQGGAAPLSISIGDDVAMDKMLQIISVRDNGSDTNLSFNSDFRFGRGAAGKIVLCSHTFSDDEFKTHEHLSLRLEEGAVLEFVVMQNEHNYAEHDTEFSISLAEGAFLNMVFLSLHGGKIRNNIEVSLNGPHSECSLSGLYLTDTEQLMDYRVNLVHNCPECRSNQLFKGILDDKGRSHFDGMVKVVPGAQKTEAFQANHNLLLSDDAKAFSSPQLEIYADDVKCSHGATVGRLNEDELFYMRTRGIGAEQARLLQQMAFANEVLDRISTAELKDRMQDLVEKRLKGEFAHCHNCSKNCC